MPIPTIPLTELNDIASFKPGYWKGKWYTPEFVHALHENFQKFSTGDNPYYVPFLNVNHKDELRHGAIYSSRMDGDTLILSAKNVPEDIAALLKSGQLGERSIEFYEPKQIGGKWDGFFDESGSLVQTPVIRCLSLLGSEAPAVKGLGAMPKPTPQKAARFSEACVSKFSSAQETSMNPELIEKLKALGFDVSLIPADATDDLLNAIIMAMQAANTNAPPAEPPAEPATFAAPVVPAVPAPVITPATGGGSGGFTLPATPSQITAKFMEDTIKAQLAPFSASLNRLRAENLVLRNQNVAQENKRKEAIVDTFLDSVRSQVLPSMRASTKTFLMKCNGGTVRTFSDGKTTGTELDEEMAKIRDGYPVHRNAPTGDPKIKQPPVTAPGSGENSVNQDRVREMLQHTPEGRAALKAKAKAAAK